MRGWMAAVAIAGLAVPAAGQDPSPLDAMVERARTAWLAHATKDLVAESDTVRLRLPGVAASAAARPGQAARLLEEYLGDAIERELVLQGVRSVEEDHAYAEFTRRYVVRGTTDPREETVFLGFRRVGGQWRLREVRIAP